MKWFILFVGVIVICLVVALLLGLAGGGMGRASTSLSHEPLPDEPIHDADFDDLVFDVGARGYRMSQVDGVVDRLRRELREKDEEIAVLRGDEPTGTTEQTGTTESTAGQVAEPAVEPVAEPVPEPAVEPVAEPAVESAAEPGGTTDPVGEPGSTEPTTTTKAPASPAPSAPTVGRERTP